MDLSKEDMPDHPRFRWNYNVNGIQYSLCEGGDWEDLRILKGYHLESACCIAYAHFMENSAREESRHFFFHKESVLKAKKWLEIMKPQSVFGKDWNGWEVELDNGSFCFRPQEKKPTSSDYWKRVLRTSKVIE